MGLQHRPARRAIGIPPGRVSSRAARRDARERDGRRHDRRMTSSSSNSTTRSSTEAPYGSLTQHAELDREVPADLVPQRVEADDFVDGRSGGPGRLPRPRWADGDQERAGRRAVGCRGGARLRAVRPRRRIPRCGCHSRNSRDFVDGDSSGNVADEPVDLAFVRRGDLDRERGGRHRRPPSPEPATRPTPEGSTHMSYDHLTTTNAKGRPCQTAETASDLQKAGRDDRI